MAAITDENGNELQRYEYDAFGRVTLSQGQVANPFLFTGREYDPETGLYFYRARVYDPDTGRFLQQDPVFALNLYPYAGNDPVNNSDPLGLDLVTSAHSEMTASGYMRFYVAVGGHRKKNHDDGEAWAAFLRNYCETQGLITTNMEECHCNSNLWWLMEGTAWDPTFYKDTESAYQGVCSYTIACDDGDSGDGGEECPPGEECEGDPPTDPEQPPPYGPELPPQYGPELPPDGPPNPDGNGLLPDGDGGLPPVGLGIDPHLLPGQGQVPPGYNDNWPRGSDIYPDKTRYYVQDPDTGMKYYPHPEDKWHWPHYDEVPGGKRYPPDSIKPKSNQKKFKFPVSAKNPWKKIFNKIKLPIILVVPAVSDTIRDIMNINRPDYLPGLTES